MKKLYARLVALLASPTLRPIEVRIARVVLAAVAAWLAAKLGVDLSQLV